MKHNKGWLALAIMVLIVVVDQVIKIVVKTTMPLCDKKEVFSWFYIYFIENNGMAYGMTFINKLVLSLFRLVAVGAISYYIACISSKPGTKTGFVVTLAMITAGALGNVIDCMFYGLCFTESTPFSIAEWTTFGNGYESFLHGKVVDMFYFPIIQTTWPDWVPWVGGDEFIFFSPIFNFADAAISVGVVWVLLFYRKELSEIPIFSNGKDKDKDNGNANGNANGNGN